MTQPLLVVGDRAAVAAGVVRWARSCGSDATDVRDAAHEAIHALEVKARRWGREDIHARVLRLSPIERGLTEIDARAVERLVCGALGVEENWAGFLALAVMEAMKSGVMLPSLPELDALVQRRMAAPRVVERAALILDMGAEHAQQVAA